MKTLFTLAVIMALATGCTTTRGTMVIEPAPGEKSSADETLFRDVLTKHGGVAYADYVLYPDVTQKALTHIQVITPYDNHNIGVERWTVEHIGQGSVSYLVKFIPDGHGGTTFTVQRDSKP
jgi:hypothetical protein